MYAVLHLAKSPREALRDLMDRSLKGNRSDSPRNLLKSWVKNDMEAVAAWSRMLTHAPRPRRDDTCFTSLLERHRGPVVHFLYRMVQNQPISEELAQEVFYGSIVVARLRTDGEVHHLAIPDRHSPGIELDPGR